MSGGNRTQPDLTGSGMLFRRAVGAAFEGLCFSSTWVGLLVLVVLIGLLIFKGGASLNWQFLTSFTSPDPAEAGILAGIWGSLWLILLTAAFAVPVGVGAALYLEEYARGTWLTRMIQLNLANLAGVPSIVYGLLGLTVFARMFGVFKPRVWQPFSFLSIPLPLEAVLLSGALTLGLLVLPIIIVATQEALRAVPQSLRHASLALGATKWQTIWHQVLPASVPGILTGVILALSRAIGETAPLIVLGVPLTVPGAPADISSPGDIVVAPWKLAQVPFSDFTALPMIVYNWVSDARPAFVQRLSAAGILVLLALLLLLNSVAIYIRQRFHKRIRW